MSKPAVDGFERSHADRVAVVRLDMRSPLGRQMASRYAIRAVPSFLMFDSSGNLSGRHIGIAKTGTLSGLFNQAAKE